MFLKYRQILIRLTFVAIFFGATALSYILLPNNNAPTITQNSTITTTSIEQANLEPNQETLKESTVVDAVVQESAKTQPQKKSTAATSTQDTETAGATTTIAENFERATLIANDKNYDLLFRADENLLAAMRRLDDTNAEFQFSGREYAGLGFFVEEINGVKNNHNSNDYWVYYINDKSAMVGVSLYLLKTNDIIKWQYGKAKI